MDYFLHISKKLSKYVKINTMIIFLLIILFAISLRVLERYQFYNFHDVIKTLKFAIIIMAFFFLYISFKYILYEDRSIPIALCFSYIYFCFEFIFRQVFINLNTNIVSGNLIDSIVTYPFAIGLMVRPIIVLFALKHSKTNIFRTMKRKVLLILFGLILGVLTTLMDIYIILPQCMSLSSQEIVITYINTLLVNSFVVIISIIYNINNRNDFSNLLIYSTLLPIFAKYYAFYSKGKNSVFLVAAEVVMLSLLTIGIVYLKVLCKRLTSNTPNLARWGDENSRTIKGVSLDKKVGNVIKVYSKSIDSFIESYRDIEDNLQEILFLVDTYGRINYASKRFYSLSGLEEEKVVGASFFTITHPEEILKARVLVNLEKSHTTPIVHRIINNNGAYIIAESIADFIFEEGNIIGKIIVSRDISN